MHLLDIFLIVSSTGEDKLIEHAVGIQFITTSKYCSELLHEGFPRFSTLTYIVVVLLTVKAVGSTIKLPFPAKTIPFI